MVDWISIVTACGLAGVVGLGFVLWERYEGQRLTRERLRHRVPRYRQHVSARSGRRAA
jgi:hypothetical protein